MERKDYAQTTGCTGTLCKSAKHELCSIAGKAEKPYEELTAIVEDVAADIGFEHDKCESELKNDAGADKSPINLLLIVGKKEGKCCDNDEANEPPENRDIVHTAPALVNQKVKKRLRKI